MLIKQKHQPGTSGLQSPASLSMSRMRSIGATTSQSVNPNLCALRARRPTAVQNYSMRLVEVRPARASGRARSAVSLHFVKNSLGRVVLGTVQITTLLGK